MRDKLNARDNGYVCLCRCQRGCLRPRSLRPGGRDRGSEPGEHRWIPQMRTMDLEAADGDSASGEATASPDLRDLLGELLVRQQRLEVYAGHPRSFFSREHARDADVQAPAFWWRGDGATGAWSTTTCSAPWRPVVRVRQPAPRRPAPVPETAPRLCTTAPLYTQPCKVSARTRAARVRRGLRAQHAHGGTRRARTGRLFVHLDTRSVNTAKPNRTAFTDAASDATGRAPCRRRPPRPSPPRPCVPPPRDRDRPRPVARPTRAPSFGR